MIIYRIIRRISSEIRNRADWALTYLKFRCNGVRCSGFRTRGVPFVMLSRGSSMAIGKNFAMNNGIAGNPIGCYEPCTFFVSPGHRIKIGDNVGISQSALIAIHDITIGNNVKIGGGNSLYTSDFHSLNPDIRNSADDLKHRNSAPIVIGDNAFIGAKCIILKGVTIGENSIVGAGSVVTKSIPPNQIWAGNPAKFIRNL